MLPSSNPIKTQTSNPTQKQKTDTVKVCIRMRPLLQHEDTEFWQIDQPSKTISTCNFSESKNDLLSDSYSLSNHPNKDIKRALIDSIYSPQSFTFDKVYSLNSNSQVIYKEMCHDITKSVLSGYNSSIFMYGQTTSGKTFTMLGSPNSPGILPCALRDMFILINKEPSPNQYSVYCSYVEIYNENIHDLLTDANYLKLIDDNKYGVVVAGAKRVKINNFEDGIGIKDYGEENRKYRETLINEYSSRSHTIFQIFIERMETNSPEADERENEREYYRNKYSCLNLVDLAGSERITEYDPKNESAGETGYINKSLFVLANVINRLADNGGKKNHIPYRDSKLTRLLSQALGGNSLTAIICTVSPAAINYYQTLSTLRFAMRAKNVKLKPLANEFLDDKGKLEIYKNEVKRLKKELESKKNYKVDNMHKSNSNNNIRNDSNEQRDSFEKMRKSNDELSNELRNYQDLYKKEREKGEKFRIEIEKLKRKPMIVNNTYTNNNNNSKDDGGIFIDDLISKITLQDSKKTPQWKDEVKKISLQYKNELNSLQNIYSTKIKNLQSQLLKENLDINNNSNNTNTNINNNNENLPNQNIKAIPISSSIINNNININYKNSNDISQNKININKYTSPPLLSKEKKNDEESKYNYNDNKIITKITNGTIFDTIELNFIPKSNDKFEDKIKNLREAYEMKVSALEKTIDYYKGYIENYYRKKIQKTRNTNMDSVANFEDNLPIMQITGEHNEMLKRLRELHDIKIKNLESVFFTNLRTLTSKQMESFNK